MMTLDEQVEEVVFDLISKNELFTALDVSNKVRETNPLARHREVRDIVRGLFSDMQLKGYDRTAIQVELADGSQTDALLYHNAQDSWDLDTKYDNQRRKQATYSSLKPLAHTIAPSSAVSNPIIPPVSPKPALVHLAKQSVPDPKELWDSLFAGVKLFPRS